ATAIFPAHHGETQREAVREHITLLRNRLRPLGVPVTFDIFGLTASATTGDLGIGQVWEDFINVADVVLPMVYPSHYYRGAFGLAWPNGEPYRVVRYALSDALQRSRPHPAAAEIRPFLQAFTLGRRLPRYAPSQIRDQIRAAEDLGITSWVLWNPRSVYQRESLRPSGTARGSPAPRSSASRPAIRTECRTAPTGRRAPLAPPPPPAPGHTCPCLPSCPRCTSRRTRCPRGSAPRRRCTGRSRDR